MAGLEIDFVVYLGDPDEGAEAVESRAAVKDLEGLKDQIDPEGPYGALVARVDGKAAFTPRPDPLMPLVTHMLKTLPYVLDGEQENILWSESPHGATMVGSGDEVLVAFFAGDAFEPDEYLLAQTPMPMMDFGAQLVGMGERLKTLFQTAAPEVLEADDSFDEFFEAAQEAFKKFKLEVEHGLRKK